jgi:hypothetical protein
LNETPAGNYQRGMSDMADKTHTTPDQPLLEIQQVDLPELAETFADSIDLVFFDGYSQATNLSAPSSCNRRFTAGAIYVCI